MVKERALFSPADGRQSQKAKKRWRIQVLRVTNIKLPLDGDDAMLLRLCARAMGVSPEEVKQVTLLRKSIDARSRQDVHYTCTVQCTVADEKKVLRTRRGGKIVPDDTKPYQLPKPKKLPAVPPVIVGMGPAGLFCGLALAEMGVPSVLVDRGRPVEQRVQDVERFFQTGMLNPASNVQFGEGGAGTFSDGKLTTGIGDPRIRWVLRQFVDAGAPEDILYQQKPHIGTDVLQEVIRSLRRKLQQKGCTFLYEHQLIGVETEGDMLRALLLQTPDGKARQRAEQTVLALGHSARDTMEMLFETGIAMEAKPFAIGVRAEHLQEAISKAQFGEKAALLPPADYKLVCHLPNGRSVFSFCVCPGGSVVAAVSEPGRLVTNGMSLRARDGAQINGGILVNVTPEDFSSGHPLAGIAFQRRWEEAAFQLGGGNYCAPAQRLSDFLSGRPSRGAGDSGIQATYLPGVVWTDLHEALPPFVSHALEEAFPFFGRKVRGFDQGDTLLTGIETRSSSPVRILRDHTLQANLRGVFPCGEGAGYAGGIMSAAVDGIRCAEAICKGE